MQGTLQDAGENIKVIKTIPAFKELLSRFWKQKLLSTLPTWKNIYINKKLLWMYSYPLLLVLGAWGMAPWGRGGSLPGSVRATLFSSSYYDFSYSFHYVDVCSDDARAMLGQTANFSTKQGSGTKI